MHGSDASPDVEGIETGFNVSERGTRGRQMHRPMLRALKLRQTPAQPWWQAGQMHRPMLRA